MTHTSLQYIEISGPDASMEIEVEVSFTFVNGCAAHYGSMTYAGHPGEPDSVEIDGFKAYEMLSADGEGRSPWKRGPQLDLTPWLRSFIESAIDQNELLEDALDDA